MTRNYAVSLVDVEAMEPGAEKAVQYAVYGLTAGESHHKQWLLERALVALGIDLDELRRELEALGCDWEPGIAP